MSTAIRPRQGDVERRLARLEGGLLELKEVVSAKLVDAVDAGSTSVATFPVPTSYLQSARVNESRALYRRAFAKFEADSPQLAILLRWYAEGMTTEQIAALLKRTPRSTRQALAEARTKVRAYLPQWQNLSWMTDVGIVARPEMRPATAIDREEPHLASAGSNDDTSADPGRGRNGARARGEAAKVRWVQDGEVVPAQDVASAWGITPQALGAASNRGEVFALKVRNRLYYPRVFIELERNAVAVVCRALGTLSASEKLVFFTRKHGSLKGQTIVAALGSEAALPHVVTLAQNWASERGAVREAEEA